MVSLYDADQIWIADLSTPEEPAVQKITAVHLDRESRRAVPFHLAAGVIPNPEGRPDHITDPDFDRRNPNRVRALLSAFASENPVHFHSADGKGYALIAREILALDATNPQVSARLVQAFRSWRRLDAARGGLVRAELERILAREGLSKDLFEMTSKLLG